MKRRLLAGLAMGLFMMWTAGLSEASLTTIGTATYYDGSEYKLIKLIYDDNNGQGLVWLDYTHGATDWESQVAWAASLNTANVITYNLNPGVPDMNWTDEADGGGWRLPTTVDGDYLEGYKGPDGDGSYSYTAGYNLANSEMGHLYYTELENLGRDDTDGNYVGDGNWGLKKTGDFDYLTASWYWSGTEYAAAKTNAWDFYMHYGLQSQIGKSGVKGGLAVRSGQPVPVPGAVWLLGSGLIGLVALRRKSCWNKNKKK